MRVFEIDHGNEERVKVKNLHTIVNFINTNCSDFVQTMTETGKFLYRGIKTPGTLSVFVGFPRDDRHVVKGLFYDKKGQELANYCNELLKQAGFAARRDNSIFCTTNYSLAGGWGKIFGIFPLNGFEFGYSTKHSNSTVGAYSYPPWNNVYFDDNRVLKALATVKMTPEEGRRFVEYNGIENTDLNKAMSINHDVWIRGKYLAVHGIWLERLGKVFNIHGVPTWSALQFSSL